MISEEKLLCAFIYSAYDSGYCGLMLDKGLKEEHMQLYRAYIENSCHFPKREIDKTQRKMMDSINNTGARDYIYRGHFDVVRERIKEETGQEFVDAIKSQLVLFAAISCPVNLYKVIELNEKGAVGKNLFLPLKRRLVILDGLEKPVVGDIVSGHWDYLLEIVSDWDNLKRYKSIARDYFKIIRRTRK